MKILLILAGDRLYRYRGVASNLMPYAPLTLVSLAALVPKELEARIELLDEGIQRPDYEGKNFDLVLSSMTLHHISDVEALLHQFFATLKPGGYLAVTDLVMEDGSFHEDNSGVAHHGINPETVRAILAKNGGQDIGVQEIHTIEKPQGNGAKRGYPVFLAWCRKGK